MCAFGVPNRTRYIQNDEGFEAYMTILARQIAGGTKVFQKIVMILSCLTICIMASHASTVVKLYNDMIEDYFSSLRIGYCSRKRNELAVSAII